MTSDTPRAFDGRRYEIAAMRILSGELPVPVQERWQPLRVGLMNVFLFEDERFPFADGRLLLRGTNGTGKSRVLAMTLPLLLDGSFKATRLEPDRDHNRQVAWNILMDDQESATGYSWLEFGRLASDKSGSNGDVAIPEQFLTIGCGMRAKRGKGISPWFFITQRRIDDSIALKSSDGIPLTQRQLTEELGADGHVYSASQRSDYRRAVDEHLFRLGDRYDSLIELLLQLRQPKLAEKLDVVGLEATLREALPPLQESLLNDAAEAFLELDQYRTSLESDRNALLHIQKFLKPYRDHVQRGVKRSLKKLTSANSRYENAQRKLREQSEEKDQYKNQLEQFESLKRQLKVDIQSGQAAIAELQRTPEIQDARRIDELASEASKLAKQFEDFVKETAQAESDLEKAEEILRIATAETNRKLDLVIHKSDEIRAIAAPEALQNQHQEQISSCLTQEGIDHFPSRKAKLWRRAKSFQQSAQHLGARNRELQAANTKLSEIKGTIERLEHSWQTKLELLTAAMAKYQTAREELWSSITAWLVQAADLRAYLPTIEAWAQQFDAWPADSADTDPSFRIVNQAKLKATSELIVRQEALRHEGEQIQTEASLLQDEVEMLNSGQLVRPPVRAHRQSDTWTESEEGIPFWMLVDFHPNIPESERGNWEAALHDAGMLDALVTSDGLLVGMDDTSSLVQLTCREIQPLDESIQLTQILHLADSHELLRDTAHEFRAIYSKADFSIWNQAVLHILSVIGVGHDASKIWVAADGRWRNGPLHGKLTKEHAQYIGSQARDHWRKQRLQELADEIVQLKTHSELLDQQIDVIEASKIQIESFVTEFPSSQILSEANTSQNAAQYSADEAFALLETERDNEVRQLGRCDALTRSRDEEAADFGLSAWADRANELERRLEQYCSYLETLEARVDAFGAALDHQNAADAHVQLMHKGVTTYGERLDVAKSELAQAEEKVRVLRESIGKDTDQMLTKLNAERQAQMQRESDFEKLAKNITDTASSLAVSDSRIEQFEEESGEFDQQRRESTDEFAELDRHGLLLLIVDDLEIPDQPWAMTTAIRFARQIDTFLQDASSDEVTWLASQTRLHKAQTELQQTVFLQDGLAIEVDSLRDGLKMVRFTMQGERLSPTTAAARIKSEIETRERILDEREQETLEKYLLGEVAEGLRKGIATAAELVEQMTTEVSRRPMKTGMQMRFRWRQDEEGPTGLAEACEVLAVDSATWSPEERDQIKLFLQRTIRQQREENETGSWHEHMRAALDYRRWHRIVIEQRKGPDANWIRLTQKTYAGGSAGEKAIALTLPPIAAAAAYYQTAAPDAPRFILLDEAFAGISMDNRESCMELIVEFGLDTVLTSESEWGMYAGVPQLAICQLDRFADLNAVVNRVFIWNGKDKMMATPMNRSGANELF